MAWRTISADEIKAKLLPAERNAIKQAQGGDTDAALDVLVQQRLPDAVAQFLGAMTAARYPVATNGSVPDQLRPHIMALAVWTLFDDFPKLEFMRTDARKTAAETAQKILENIPLFKYGAIEAPAGTVANGTWNSEQKLIMRTHPTPPPAQQMTGQTNFYANPLAPTDP